MRYSSILEQHIYFVDFEPHRECEFDQRHLALVLKRNSDKKTFIVVPLTTESAGLGSNKVDLGKLTCLPSNLQDDHSYLVYNQVRTVNYTRFFPLKDDTRTPINCKLDDQLFAKSISFCIDEITTNLSLSSKIAIYRQRYIENTITLLVNTAYNIKKALCQNTNEDTILSLQAQICDLLQLSFDYKKYISTLDKDNGIIDIIDCCLATNILSMYQENNNEEKL